MATKSPTFFERLSLSRADSPILPLHSRPRKKPSEYDLAELEPRPEQPLLSPSATNDDDAYRDEAYRDDAYHDDDVAASQRTPRTQLRGTRRPSAGAAAVGSPSPSPSPFPPTMDDAVRGEDNAWPRSPGSDSKRKPRSKVLFAGPPPPIAASMVMPRQGRKTQPRDRDREWERERERERQNEQRQQQQHDQRQQHQHREDHRQRMRSPQSGRLTDERENTRGGLGASKIVTFGSAFLDRPVAALVGAKSRASVTTTPPALSPDSVWRGLQRREAAIQRELQDLLDMQASGLLAGGGGGGSEAPGSSASTSERGDTLSDTGSSTPTGTFYSTATSKSRMMASSTIEQPTRSTSRGDVIPVRQPRRPRGPRGLRAARRGLARAMADLADLKAEEGAHVSQALAQRRKALAQLVRLAKRRTSIHGELEALEGDAEEPLGRELRDLGSEHEALSAEIRETEERLVGMRNRRRWLEAKMDDVRSRREAGLSGYRGALREVEGEVAALMRRPPVRPLDLDVLQRSRSPARSAGGVGGDDDDGLDGSSPGGAEFLRLIPERRTVEMARHWWEGETAILERRRTDVDKEREALEQGGQMWAATVKVVADFEAELRASMRGGAAAEDVETDGKGKGKGRAGAPPTHQEIIRAQLPKMERVAADLEARMRTAEERQWNLLICAVGAELEAFREAEHVLRQTLDELDGPAVDEAAAGDGGAVAGAQDRDGGLNGQLVDVDTDASGVGADTSTAPAYSTGSAERRRDESDTDHDNDNEVPADLLVSNVEDHDHDEISELDRAKIAPGPLVLKRIDSTNSENEVPLEFLREHTQDSVD